MMLCSKWLKGDRAYDVDHSRSQKDSPKRIIKCEII